MFAKIVKGKDLTELESEVNKYLSDITFGPGIDKDSTRPRVIIHNVQQFVIGRSDTSTVSLIDPKLQITYYFCLLLICGYE